MSEESQEATAPRIKVFIELEELSSKQRNAVLGVIKDMGFVPAEVAQVGVIIPEQGQEPDGREGRRQKRE